jgi:sigma-E factor negative regulatory protein RseC
MSKDIEYHGIIKAIRSGNLVVQIDEETGCSACEVRKSCGIADKQEKQIEIPFTSGKYKEGDAVRVTGKASMGLTAVCFAFLIPLLLLLAIVIAASYAGRDEGTAAVLALLSVAGYYALLYVFRNKLKQQLTFNIQ